MTKHFNHMNKIFGVFLSFQFCVLWVLTIANDILSHIFCIIMYQFVFNIILKCKSILTHIYTPYLT